MQQQIICECINCFGGDVEALIRLVGVVLLWLHGVLEGFRALLGGSLLSGALKDASSLRELRC